ncbi:MAG: hypothetical protein JXN10_07550 [Clostridia bacterium]|nr:hypothetical protein [Clostridia bacterium]MBN2883367.1 hypothetical protein [Clostridia bacterium]
MEKNFVQLHRDVCFKPDNKKIIWQPRIGCWISDHISRDGKLPEPYSGMSKPELYRALGCSARIYEYNDCFVRTEDPRVSISVEEIEAGRELHTISSPVGKITCIMRRNSSNVGKYYEKWWVNDEDELKILEWIDSRAHWTFDRSKFDELTAEWNGLGAPCMYMPRIGIQHLFIRQMGFMNTAYALADYPALIRKYCDALEENQESLIEVINSSPVDIINYGDNLHDGYLPPEVFEEYVLPAYRRRGELLHKAGKFTYSHWDGDVKRILQYAQECELDGIEAVTPVPQGDVTLQEAKEAMGDMFMIDCIAAILFDERYSEEELLDQAREVIDLFAPRLILGISDEISSTGNIERVKLIGKLVDEYNEKV